MPRYRVTIKKVLDFPVDVEAETPEDAVDVALESDAAHTQLCHHCSNHANDNDWEASSDDVELIEETPNA